ncbi:MAG: hypothetical protein D6741_13055 [Planctomycetota bacterium]|nr:MAG: hypothetical protein D6741_13055 [Planctomycetota bacterium]
MRSAVEFDGLNGGINGGRACWAVPKNGREKVGGPVVRSPECAVCPFYQLVACEEMPEVLEKRRNALELNPDDDLSIPPVSEFLCRFR